MTSSKKNKIKKTGGVATWLITDNCNYKCSYCFAHKSKLKVEDHVSFLKNIRNKIPRNWSFYILGGGEPFTHPNFFEIIDGLVKAGYRLSITSNFSASLNKLNRFFKITGKNLDFFNASLHLEHAQAQVFVKKILALKKSFPDKKIFVTTVAIKGKIKEAEYLKQLFFDKKIKLLFLRLRRRKKNKEFKNINYSLKERACFSFSNQQKYISLTDQFCDAGYKRVTILPAGDIFRCIEGTIKTRGYLGNILTNGFAFYEKSLPCEEEFCICGNTYSKYKKIANKIL